MKVTEENIVKEDGTTINVVTKEVNSEDGWVHQNDLSTTGSGYGEYFKGKQVVKSFTINDPKLYWIGMGSILGIFFIIGVCIMIFGNIIVGGVFTGFIVCAFIVELKNAKRRKLEREQRNNNQNNVNK